MTFFSGLANGEGLGSRNFQPCSRLPCQTRGSVTSGMLSGTLTPWSPFRRWRSGWSRRCWASRSWRRCCPGSREGGDAQAECSTAVRMNACSYLHHRQRTLQRCVTMPAFGTTYASQRLNQRPRLHVHPECPREIRLLRELQLCTVRATADDTLSRTPNPGASSRVPGGRPHHPDPVQHVHGRAVAASAQGCRGAAGRMRGRCPPGFPRPCPLIR